MALPIKDTPVLKGMAENSYKKASKEELKAINDSYDKINNVFKS